MADDESVVYKEGDTDPPILYRLEERDPDTGEWGPMLLEGRTIVLSALETRSKRRFGGPAVATGVPGEVAYHPLPGDLTVGDWRYEYAVMTPDGSRQTVPRDRYLELRVIPRAA